jgi:hypothetical protein
MVLACLAPGLVYAGTCTTPPGKEADYVYNYDYHTFQFCNGSSWIAMGSCGCGPPIQSPITAPNGSGYFVLSHDTYDGNLGGLSGADAKCLTDLTTHTGWMGYATANSNGQLVASKVHAFLCYNDNPWTCNNTMPLTATISPMPGIHRRAGRISRPTAAATGRMTTTRGAPPIISAELIIIGRIETTTPVQIGTGRENSPVMVWVAAHIRVIPADMRPLQEMLPRQTKRVGVLPTI